MNARAIKAVVRKDLKIVFQNKSLILPAMFMPLLILVGFPLLVSLFPQLQRMPGTLLAGIDKYLVYMPVGLKAELAGYSQPQMVYAVVLIYFLAPLYLILPLMISSIIAADSFAGEKERKTLEALLYSPATDRELFLAKLLSAWLPALGIAWGGGLLYSIVVNAAGWHIMGRIFFPNTMWALLSLWVAPAIAGLGLSVMVLVSARAKSFQDAYQLGSAVVVPVILLFVAQAAGLFYFNALITLLLGLVLWVVDAWLLRLGGQAFRRFDMARRL